MYSWGGGYRPSPDLSPCKPAGVPEGVLVVKSVPAPGEGVGLPCFTGGTGFRGVPGALRGGRVLRVCG